MVGAGRTCSTNLRGVSSPTDLGGASSSVHAMACYGIRVKLTRPMLPCSSSSTSTPHTMLGSSSSSSSLSSSLSFQPCQRFTRCSFAHSFFAFFAFTASATVWFTALLAASSSSGRSDSWAKRSGYKS